VSRGSRSHARRSVWRDPSAMPSTHNDRSPTPTTGRSATRADTTAIRSSSSFVRLVEIRPVARLPETVLRHDRPTIARPTDRAEIRYPVHTQPRFTVEALRCERQDCAAGNDLHFYLTAPVQRESLLAHLHVEPRVPFTLGRAAWHRMSGRSSFTFDPERRTAFASTQSLARHLWTTNHRRSDSRAQCRRPSPHVRPRARLLRRVARASRDPPDARQRGQRHHGDRFPSPTRCAC
jgi:hypothetical protein